MIMREDQQDTSHSRRHFLKLVARGTAAAIIGTCYRMPQTVQAQIPSGYNVLFIAVDDLRPELGCFGHEYIHSPNIDRLASEGLRFTRAYCQQAICGPSRNSLLTGCRPDTIGVTNNNVFFRDTMPDLVSLPQHFKKHGYHTRSHGKVFHGGQTDPLSWSQLSAPDTSYSYDYYDWRPVWESYALPENQGHMTEKNLLPPVEWADVDDNAYSDGMIADKVIEALNEVDSDTPFFIAAGFYKPHLPFAAPKRYWDLYDPATIELAPNPFSPEDVPSIALSPWGELRAYKDELHSGLYGVPETGPVPDDLARVLKHGYYSCVSFIDAQVGRLLDELDSLNLRDNTVVILWGDHGWQLGEHALWCKHTNFEIATNAPMIISIPGQPTAGNETDALTEFVDIYPTLCKLCELPLPSYLEGTSFYLLTINSNLKWKTAAFSQYPRSGYMGYTMKTDRYRYTEWRNKSSGAVYARELYDHLTDPEENYNIAGRPENAGLVLELAAALDAGWRGALPPGPQSAEQWTSYF